MGIHTECLFLDLSPEHSRYSFQEYKRHLIFTEHHLAWAYIFCKLSVMMSG